MEPAARTELLGLVDTARYVPVGNEAERCVMINETDMRAETVQRVGEEAPGVRCVYIGATGYRVVMYGTAYTPYVLPVTVRTSIIVVRGTRRHYVGVAPNWWIYSGRSYYGYYGGYYGGYWGYYGYGYGYGYGWRNYGTRTYHHHGSSGGFRSHTSHSASASSSHRFGGFGGSHHSGFSS